MSATHMADILPCMSTKHMIEECATQDFGPNKPFSPHILIEALHWGCDREIVRSFLIFVLTGEAYKYAELHYIGDSFPGTERSPRFCP